MIAVEVIDQSSSMTTATSADTDPPHPPPPPAAAAAVATKAPTVATAEMENAAPQGNAEPNPDPSSSMTTATSAATAPSPPPLPLPPPAAAAVATAEMENAAPKGNAEPKPDPSPSWFTPRSINMLNYVDRGTIASNGVNGRRKTCNESGICTSGTGIQGDFSLNNFEDGALSSAFMVGLLVSSPIFASLAKSHNPFKLTGVGLSVWTLATGACGFSFDFWSIIVCRMLVGVGEASFISLAAPFIDDNAPASQKTSWLAVFYMCIPTGFALGYVYGGLVGNHLSWRAAFWGVSILMLPFAILAFIIKRLEFYQLLVLTYTSDMNALAGLPPAD